MVTMRVFMMVLLSGFLLSSTADAAESVHSPSGSQELSRLQAQANRGDAAAQLKLAMMYYSGQAQNKAAVESQATVNHNLALMYAHGRSVPQNYAETWKWRHKDADLGHAKVENVNDNLALMYAHGRSMPQNYAEAWKWRHAAAEQGVPQSYAKALEWALIAKAEGDHDAIHDISLIEGKATSAQITRGQAMAHRWESNHL